MFNIDTPIEPLDHPFLKDWDGELWIKRDDLIHPVVSGNKWRKLSGYIENMKASSREGLLTFGGAYSNHIAATAHAGKLLGIRTVGVIRGDELHPDSNETLKKAAADGMELVFVSREEYNLKSDFDYKKQLRLELGNLEIVPEGGAGFYGMMGCQKIPEGYAEFDRFVVACGTGTTMAGMLIGMRDEQRITGVSVLKGGFMEQEVKTLLNTYFMDSYASLDYENQWEFWNDDHLGGFAKINPDYLEFIRDFYALTQIKLDPLYTGKLFYALLNKIKKEKKFSGEKILAIHTGGLQAVSGVEARHGVRLFPQN